MHISAVGRRSVKEVPSVSEQRYRYFIYSATSIIKALVCSDCPIVRITGFQIKLFIKIVYSKDVDTFYKPEIC
jgi:hypothetical protein